MIFREVALAGAWLLDIEPIEDERGFFARTFCAAEFARRGLAAPVAQSSLSFNARRGTLRGLHFQAPPDEEEKLVRCTSGAIFDVIVDLRPGSPTRHGWFGTELSAENHRALYIPKGCAHGFITLREACEVLYMMSVPHVPRSARGVRWNDPAFGIRWPLEPTVMSTRDAVYPLVEAAVAR